MTRFNGICLSFWVEHQNNIEEKMMEGRALWVKYMNGTLSNEDKKNNYDIMIYTADVDHNKNYSKNELVSISNKVNSFNERCFTSSIDIMGEVMIMSLNRNESLIVEKAIIPNEMCQKNFESYLEGLANL